LPELVVAAWDRRLRAGAGALGLGLAPAELGSTRDTSVQPEEKGDEVEPPAEA
jgi:hypothetical protein